MTAKRKIGTHQGVPYTDNEYDQIIQNYIRGVSKIKLMKMLDRTSIDAINKAIHRAKTNSTDYKGKREYNYVFNPVNFPSITYISLSKKSPLREIVDARLALGDSPDDIEVYFDITHKAMKKYMNQRKHLKKNKHKHKLW